MTCDVLETNCDLVISAGDSIGPIFDVAKCDGSAFDISQVNEIEFAIEIGATQTLRKLKSTGGITFVNDGTDGLFQVDLQPADTAALSGWYGYKAIVTDHGGNIGTVRRGYVEIQP